MKKILSAGFLTILVFVYALSYGMNHTVHTADANYKLICDDLDATGGKSSSTNYKLMVTAGGQSSPIGSGSSANYQLLAGYVYASFVEHGDANGSGSVDLADAVYIVNWLFIGGPAPDPLEAGDANCSGGVDLADAVYIVNWLFIGGPPPCGS